jgi:hypothetical protein
MKALSLWQPWASLWARGRKTYETRDWSTPYRGPLAIHAAKTLKIDVSSDLQEILEDEFGDRWQVKLPAGALIAVCELIDCLPTEHLHVDSEEYSQGNFTRGRYAWGVMNLRVLAHPIPFRGQMGLFDVPDALLGAPVASPPATPQQKLL